MVYRLLGHLNRLASVRAAAVAATVAAAAIAFAAAAIAADVSSYGGDCVGEQHRRHDQCTR